MQNSSPLRRLFLAFLTALGFAFLLYCWRKNGDSYVIWDDGEYWLNNISLYHIYQEKGLGSFFTHLFFGRYGRPNILSILGAPFFAVSGLSIQTANLLFSVCFTFIFSFCLSAFFQNIIRPGYLALLAGIFFCSHSLFFQNLTRYMPELPYLAFAAATAWAYTWKNRAGILVSALCTGMLFCLRPFESMILMAVISASHFFLFPAKANRLRHFFHNLLMPLILPFILFLSFRTLNFDRQLMNTQFGVIFLLACVGLGFVALVTHLQEDKNKRIFFIIALLPAFFWLIPRAHDVWSWVSSVSAPSSDSVHTFAKNGFRQFAQYLSQAIRIFGSTSFYAITISALLTLKDRKHRRFFLFALIQLFIPLALLYLGGDESTRVAFTRYFILNLLLYYGIFFYLFSQSSEGKWIGAAITAFFIVFNLTALISGIFFPSTNFSNWSAEYDQAFLRSQPHFSLPVEKNVLQELEKVLPKTPATFGYFCESPPVYCFDATSANLLSFEKKIPWNFFHRLIFINRPQALQEVDYFIIGPLQTLPLFSKENKFAEIESKLLHELPRKEIHSFPLRAKTPVNDIQGTFLLFKMRLPQR